jgi:DNA-binding response OmpR family regulator
MSKAFTLCSILIVEDEIPIRKKLVEYVKFDYKNVYEASSENEAFKIYKEKKPNLIILDINLKEGNGLNLLRNIRQNDHKTRAIVISAYSHNEYLMEAIDLKLSKYIIKPITRKSFKEALEVVQKEIDKFSIENNEILELSKNYKWDYKKKELVHENKTLSLGSKEHQLLKLFCDNVNRVLSYENIANELWNYTLNDKKNSIKIIIKKLRKNLPKDIIENIYGIGYKLNN